MALSRFGSKLIRETNMKGYLCTEGEPFIDHHASMETQILEIAGFSGVYG
jgi:hypothetical protein